MTTRLPTWFLGHGNPMNALDQNTYTNAWAELGKSLQRPKAILVISAHWYISTLAVTAMKSPRTIHDFGGFPEELFRVLYPAPGAPEFAKRVQEILAPESVLLDERWGLDHGTWSVLCHIYPEANIPVVQLSINHTQSHAYHYELGKRLSGLRDEGVLVIGSGNVVHNLMTYAWGEPSAKPYNWAISFENRLKELVLAGDHQPLIEYEKLGREALLAVPTPDHYLPFLYLLGMQQTEDKVSFPVEGMDGGSVSMLAVQFG